MINPAPDFFGLRLPTDSMIKRAARKKGYGCKGKYAKGDPASPAALDLARRWKAQLELFTKGDPGVTQKVQRVWNDAMADPKAAPQLPLNPEIFAFVGKAQARLKELGG